MLCQQGGGGGGGGGGCTGSSRTASACRPSAAPSRNVWAARATAPSASTRAPTSTRATASRGASSATRRATGPGSRAPPEDVRGVERLLASLDPARAPERAQVALERQGAAARALELASHRDVSSEAVRARRPGGARARRAGRAAVLPVRALLRPALRLRRAAALERPLRPRLRGPDRRAPTSYESGGSTFDRRAPRAGASVASAPRPGAPAALYAGELAWTDAQVGRLLAGSRLGLAGDTLVVVDGRPRRRVLRARRDRSPPHAVRGGPARAADRAPARAPRGRRAPRGGGIVN